MLPFIAEHRPMILSGRKTETRRDWSRPRAKEGSVHQARLGTWGKPFAWLLIDHVHQEPLIAIDQAGAEREGYRSVGEFMDVWRGLHGTCFDEQKLITVVRWAYPLFGLPGDPTPLRCWKCGADAGVSLGPDLDHDVRVCSGCGHVWPSRWGA